MAVYDANFGIDGKRPPLVFGEIEDYRISEEHMQLAMAVAAENRSRCIARMRVYHASDAEVHDIQRRLRETLHAMR